MEELSSPAQRPNFKVKSIEPIMTGSDMQARLFTLAPGETIPWHYHETAADHYFVLEGALTDHKVGKRLSNCAPNASNDLQSLFC
jgi:quercetin dioxygenase-like cupin family protein